MKTLIDLHKNHTGKISDKWALYLLEYDRIFAPFRDQPISLLEIGVQNGGSLEVWSQYFPRAQRFIGCDINPDCGGLSYEDPRIAVVVGDATTAETQEKVFQHSASFDLVIEDGSHTSRDIVKAFEKYFPALSEGGVFVAEDLHCSYWQEFEGGIFYPYSSVNFFKSLADVINHEHWGVDRKRTELIVGFKEKYSVDITEDLLAAVHSVEFLNSMCIVRKLSPELNLLGDRCVSGTEESVVEGLLLRGVHNETIQQENNYWSRLVESPAECHLQMVEQVAQFKTAAIGAQEVSQRLRENLEGERTESQKLRDDLLAERGESHRLRDELLAAQAESQTLRDGLQAEQTVSLKLRNDVLAQQAELQKLRADIQAHQAESERLRCDLQAQHVEYQRLLDHGKVQQADVERLNNIVHAVHSSRSWRYTEAVRKALAYARVPKDLARQFRQKAQRSGGYAKLMQRVALVLKKDGLSGLIRRVNESELGSHASVAAVEIKAEEANAYQDWVNQYSSHDAKSIQGIKQMIEAFSIKPKISVIMPVYNTPLNFLEEAIQSVVNQAYENWELCIADDASTDLEMRPFLERYQERDARIRVIFRGENGHISKSSNSALGMATGDFAALLDHDDVLPVDALFWVVEAINKQPGAKLIYSDEDKIDHRGVRCEPFFKPDWSPHLAMSQAYLGHLVVFDIRSKKPVFSDEFVGSQDYDLWLSLSNGLRRDEVVHISRILYHWRKHQDSTAENPGSKLYADDSGLRAVSKYMAKRYPGARAAVKKGEHLFTYACDFHGSDGQFVSIIIPTKDRVDLLSECIESIFAKTKFKRFEVIILNNNSVERETFEYFSRMERKYENLRVVDANIEFNWSKLNNIGVSHAVGNVFVFLNNDTSIISPDWLSCLSGYAVLPDVGVVGGLLLFQDGSIQHSGVVVGMGGWADHVYRTMPAIHTSGTGFVSPVMTRNVLAVTGACMAIARDKFEAIGGFDENFVICGSDVEICIRAHNKGYFNVMCGEVRLFHYESKTRTSFVPEVDFQQSSIKYEPYRTMKTDPFYNRNLSLAGTCPAIEGAPRDL